MSFCCLRRRKQAKDDLPGPHRPPIAFIGSRSSRISRVRSSLIPSGGRARRAHSSFDLLPPAAMHESSMRNSPLHQSVLPVAEDDYIPSPYILPSDTEAVDGHSGRYSESYPRAPPRSVPHSPIGGAIGYAQSHSRSHSRSESDGHLSPSSPFSSPYSQAHMRSPSVPSSPTSPGVTSPKGSVRSPHRLTPRFILHTDAEDMGNSEGEEADVVELPPQYTDRRESNTKLDDHVKRSDRSPS